MAYGVVFDLPIGKHISQIIVFAFTTVDIKIFINVKILATSTAMPSLPLIKIVVVYPTGKNPALFSCVQCDCTIVVFMIFFKRQDSALLVLLDIREFALHKIICSQNNLYYFGPSIVCTKIFCLDSKIHP